MNINDYVMNFAQTNGFPDKLVLSKDLAGDFYRLWEEGERRSIEIGYNMLYDRNSNVLAPDKLNKFEGTAIYTVFPDQSAANIYGDVHMLSTFKSEKQAAMWMLNAKKMAPGFGVEMQRLSIKYCKKVANTMNLGFYAGYRGLFGWYTNQAFTLERKV